MSHIKKEVMIGDCRLLLGDCMEIMPLLTKIDAMVTDPPYGIGHMMIGSGHFAGLCKKMGGVDGWDNSTPDPEIFLRDYPVIAWGANYLGLPPSRGWLAWVKSNATKSFASIELAWSNMDFNAKHFTAPCGAPRDEKVNHPTQKPVSLMQWCISFLPKGTKTILDPFMGSGTTGVACVKMGLSFIGIEQDEEYFDIACNRIYRAYAQPDMFIERQKLMQQEMEI